MDARPPLVLDTDIGSDVDDLIALVIVGRASERRLVGVTTVYGDTPLRARIARHACDLLGLPGVAVVAGRREPLSGRPVWWGGHEGEGIDDLDRVEVDERQDAVAYLTAAARAHAGGLDVLAVGPLTNVAAALQADGGFASGLRRLYVMGGDFSGGRSEHNFLSDAAAADVVFRSGVPVSVVGLEITTQLWFEERDVRRMEARADPVGQLLGDQIRRYWRVRGQPRNHPHDPLAAMLLLEPDLFELYEAEVTIVIDGDDAGRSVAERRAGGHVRVARSVDVRRAREALVDRLVR